MAPTWAPPLDAVAVHIPSRTREVGNYESNEYLGTFGTTTTPTAAQVTALIDKACTWVTGQTGLPLMPAAEPLCAVAASLWAAYWVELGYPERDADVSVYDKLRVDAESATKAAVAFNDAAGGGWQTDPTPADTNLVVGSFPEAPSWGDAGPGLIW